ncbi:S46 family peptidase [Luteolibacter ambystomatis]|uniref:Dipeptidyl-peptidase n=1 Tax=Luteolibacter ambystomatis TaxID=2824561 RepID=A0A975G6Y5_9BACT|nr:S46 family peptidase [Luteolibacter ambystomatis]QUE50464.1 S46 family peptidase [Luteolibacter ambystomatis]
MSGRSVRAAAFLFLITTGARGDEGMWLFNKPPVRQVKERYGFEMKPEWLDHLQRSAVHFGGGSGSFVSGDGLVLTNHHVAAGTLEKLGSAEHDYLKDGFSAATLSDELRCPDMELKVLMDIQDVTRQVTDAVAAKNPAEAVAARREVIARIEREALAATGMRSDVITLYRGGAYHLYQYKRYTDVRLVFAPEKQAGAFGGDPDNFEFPRWDLDMAFFRVYENGQPAKTPDYLKWSTTGAKEGELIFVAGHPGRTDRADTHAELIQARDHSLPQRLDAMLRNETLLSNWSARSEENRRRASGLITGIQNGRKSIQARLEGLLDPVFMAKKASEEQALRASFAASQEWKKAAEAFDEIAAIEAAQQPSARRERMLEGAEGFNSSLFSIARTLLRAGQETPKPDGQRLREFRSAARSSLELSLFSTRPIYKDLEIEKLANSLTLLCGTLGADDPLVVSVMAGKPPRDRATELIQGTRLENPAFRRQLYDGGTTAVTASKDPMIALATLIESESRTLRDQEDTAGESITRATETIALARFALGGDAVYPDATSSLRLAFGTVKGYETAAGKVPWSTTLGGLAETSAAHRNQPPYQMPANWEGKTFDRDIPFNFISTADITGGNSGSPVVNQAGELVGLIFDGNAPSLTCGYAYSDKTARAVSVHSAGMLEALRQIYHANRIVKEITR